MLVKAFILSNIVMIVALGDALSWSAGFWSQEHRQCAHPTYRDRYILIMPESRGAWYFALFWLIPVACYFFRIAGSLLAPLGATFTAHAVGGALWALFNPLPASLWYSLIPVVARERPLLSFGIVISLCSAEQHPRACGKAGAEIDAVGESEIRVGLAG